MSNLNLPESEEERKKAYERIIAQLMTRVFTPFPDTEIDKKEFLSELVKHYKEDKRLYHNCSCKWGRIVDPAKFLETLKNESWEFEGVKRFFNTYSWKREIRKKEKEIVLKQKKEHKKRLEELKRTRKLRRKEYKEKNRSYDEALCIKLEQELNEYGKQYGVRTDLDYLKNWKGKWFEIYGHIGVFFEYAVYTCSYEEMKDELKWLVRENQKHPKLLQEINEEREYWLSET